MSHSSSKTQKLRRTGDSQSLGGVDAPVSNRWLALGGLAAIGLAWAWLNRQRNLDGLPLPLNPLVQPLTIWTGTSRGSQADPTINLVCVAGQPVYAPFSGTVTRESIPFPNDKQWRSITFESDTTSLICTVLYCTTAKGVVGRRVARGQFIGVCQSSSKGVAGSADYINVCMRYKGKLIDPKALMFNPRNWTYPTLPF